VSEFREFLQHQFEVRVQKKRGYSLRAFSRDLGFSPSMISEVLSGKKRLTLKAAYRISEKLKLSKVEEQRWIQSISSPALPKASVRSLANDELAILSDPQGFVVLALFGIHPAGMTVERVTRALGCFRYQAQEWLNRLERLKCITRQGKSYALAQEFVMGGDQNPSDAVVRFHQTLLHKNAERLARVPKDERDLLAFVLPLDSSDLDLIREEIRKCFEEIRVRYGQKSTANRVYNLQSVVMPETSVGVRE
jgi:transcriptional regulator with XRE-family HTH domain